MQVNLRIHICKYKSMQVCQYVRIKLCKYVSMQLCIFASMIFCKNARMQVYAHIWTYASMQISHFDTF